MDTIPLVIATLALLLVVLSMLIGPVSYLLGGEPSWGQATYFLVAGIWALELMP